MDEVIDPAMTLKITGFLRQINTYNFVCENYLLNGLSLYNIWLNKLKVYIIKMDFSYIKYNFHTLTKSKKRVGPHNEDVISVIIGSLLGDGYANKRYLKGTRLCFRQSIKHKDYLYWLFYFFNERGYCSNLEPRLYNRVLNYKDSLRSYQGYEFNTFTFTSFDWIQKMFYKNKKKRIHSNLGKYLTPLAMSIWISDDGCWTGYGVRIACNCYTLKEIKLLADLLSNIFNLSVTIQKIGIKNKYSIYIKKESILNLRKIISPFIHPSMKYKIGLK